MSVHNIDIYNENTVEEYESEHQFEFYCLVE